MSNKDCGNKVPCGCEDEALTTPPPCGQGTPECPDPEPCVETFSAGCIIWNGGELTCEGATIATNGERMDVVLQRFLTLACSAGIQGPIGYGFTVDTGAPSGAPEDNRIYYLDLSTGDMYEWDGATWNLIGTLGGGGPLNQTYNITSPLTGLSYLNITLDRAANSTALGDIIFAADKIGDDDVLTIDIVSPDGVTFNGGVTSLTLGLTNSVTGTELEHPVGLPVGTYNLTFEWSGTSVNRVQNVTLNLT